MYAQAGPGYAALGNQERQVRAELGVLPEYGLYVSISVVQIV